MKIAFALPGERTVVAGEQILFDSGFGFEMLDRVSLKQRSANACPPVEKALIENCFSIPDDDGLRIRKRFVYVSEGAVFKNELILAEQPGSERLPRSGIVGLITFIVCGVDDEAGDVKFVLAESPYGKRRR